MNETDVSVELSMWTINEETMYGWARSERNVGAFVSLLLFLFGIIHFEIRLRFNLYLCD